MTVINQSFANTTGWPKKSLRSYVLGFILCVLLTFVAFGLVKYTSLSNTMIYALLTGLGIMQLVIQAVCFLGLKSGENGKWNGLPFLFTLLIIFFIVGGSLWIMHNLNVLMMDSSAIYLNKE